MYTIGAREHLYFDINLNCCTVQEYFSIRHGTHHWLADKLADKLAGKAAGIVHPVPQNYVFGELPLVS